MNTRYCMYARGRHRGRPSLILLTIPLKQRENENIIILEQKTSIEIIIMTIQLFSNGLPFIGIGLSECCSTTIRSHRTIEQIKEEKTNFIKHFWMKHDYVSSSFTIGRNQSNQMLNIMYIEICHSNAIQYNIILLKIPQMAVHSFWSLWFFLYLSLVFPTKCACFMDF